ncbi:MAG TPA: hypothetical protein VG028_18310 [Terriglobia bacterium]|nr:hypothetical protein [Terriglobia bacterium]
MGRKLLVSLAMEGKFSAEGLQGMDEGEDILMAMARELVTEKGIGESASAVWKRLQQEQQEVFGVRAEIEQKPESESLVDAVSDVAVSPQTSLAVVDQLLMFGASLEDAKRRKVSRRSNAAAMSDQLTLF